MKTQHTPGPWSWNEVHNLIDARSAYEDGKRYVTDLSDKVSPADAYLIAAAPEMLEALKDALCWLDPDCKLDGVAYKGEGYHNDKEKMIIGLYEAIAKAEGR